MTGRILIIGGGSASLGAALAALGMQSVTTAGEFRELVSTMPCETYMPLEHFTKQSVPKFGGDRPYLKRKKGRS